jgi:ATP-dependent RNA/DNA helicase IGHMBP2
MSARSGRGDATARLEELGRLWRVEREATRRRYLEERSGVPLADRVAGGVALRDLRIEETAAAAGGRILCWLAPRRAEDLHVSRIGVGDPVRLWRGSETEDTLAAIVARRSREKLAVVIDAEGLEWMEAGPFALDREAPQATFDRGDRAISRFAAGGDLAGLRELFYGDAAGAPGQVSLIFGPPGTGKTTALVEIIRAAVADGERVLATAASNTAVDNLAERLGDLELVRLGHPARVSERVEARTLDALLEGSDTWELSRSWMAEAAQLRRQAGRLRARGDRTAAREASSAARGLERDAREHLAREQGAILARAQVVCATAAGSDVALLGGEVFDLVALDEATQAVDPVALVALARGRRIVMAGDPRQLPPTVIAPEAAPLSVTLFERLAERPELVRMLTVQHRMHAVLMRFPSESMYGGRLEAAPDVAAHTLEDLGVAADPLRPGPLVFIDTAGTGWHDTREGEDPSTQNPAAGARVAAEVRRLLGRGLSPDDLAVITPYEAQVRLLRALLADAGVEIGTVDGFQGREKEAVVVDLVRSNEAGEIGFLADTRRMNVALTRARRFLLVVGDSGTLGAHAYYSAFLRSVETAGGWISAWSDEAPPW